MRRGLVVALVALLGLACLIAEPALRWIDSHALDSVAYLVLLLVLAIICLYGWLIQPHSKA